MSPYLYLFLNVIAEVKQITSIKINKITSYKFKLVIIPAFIGFAIGCSGTKPYMNHTLSKNNVPEEFSASALYDDFDQLLNTISMVHVDPFKVISSDSLKLLFHEANTENKTYSQLDAYRTISKHVALLNDGHTGVFAPPISDNVALLPFILEKSSNGYRIAKDITGKKRFTNLDIISVNGKNIREILNEITACISGELEEFRIYTACQKFPQYLYFAAGVKRPFSIKVNAENGSTQVLKEDGLAVSELKKGIFDYYAIEPFEISYIDSLNMAVMTLNNMKRYKKFKNFLKKTMNYIAKKDIEILTIDVRKNYGGTDRIFMELFNEISTIPYCLSDSVYIRKTDPESNTDSIYIQTCMRKIVPEGENAFNGEIYILMDEGTFSSASSLAWIAQRYGIATLVGRTSGSPCTRSAAVNHYTLKNTRLKYMVPTKKIVRLGCPENKVIPDIIIPASSTTENDILKYFIKYISEKRKKLLH